MCVCVFFFLGGGGLFDFPLSYSSVLAKYYIIYHCCQNERKCVHEHYHLLTSNIKHIMYTQSHNTLYILNI